MSGDSLGCVQVWQLRLVPGVVAAAAPIRPRRSWRCYRDHTPTPVTSIDTISSVQHIDAFVVVGLASGAVNVFSYLGVFVGSLGAGSVPWSLRHTAIPSTGNVPSSDTCVLAAPVRLSTSMVTVVKDVCDPGMPGAAINSGTAAPAGTSTAAPAHAVVTTTHLLDSKGLVRVAGASATYHGEVPDVGEVWTRSSLDVATSSRVLTHVVTITRVDPQQDVLIGYSGLFATRKDAVAYLAQSKAADLHSNLLVSFSFSEFIEVRACTVWRRAVLGPSRCVHVRWSAVRPGLFLFRC